MQRGCGPGLSMPREGPPVPVYTALVTPKTDRCGPALPLC